VSAQQSRPFLEELVKMIEAMMRRSYTATASLFMSVAKLEKV